jgi:predicted kinase
MLAVVCGPPGTGKTTVSEWIARRHDAHLIRTDVVRGDAVDDPEYTEAERKRVYEAVFRRIEAGLGDGSSVVADGTFDRREYRERARRSATQAGVRFELVRVTCDPGTVERRIERREDDESDATVENYHEIRDGFDPVTGPCLRIDNSGSREATERALRAHFEQ